MKLWRFEVEYAPLWPHAKLLAHYGEETGSGYQWHWWLIARRICIYYGGKVVQS